jgi:dTDP-4-dehydrorhamnose reductase
MKSRLILGDGLLGSQIHKITNWDFISRKKNKIDFNNIHSYYDYLNNYEEIINCIANTNTYSTDKDLMWKTNVVGLSDLVDTCSICKKKIIHISSDYIYSNSIENASEEDVPVHCANWYGYTKLIGDAYVQLKAGEYLLIRTTQKKKPFTHECAFINQIGNFDYVDKIAPIIVDLIEKNATGVFNVGTELKTMMDLAKQTKNDVKPGTYLFDPTMPTNVSMNINKLKNFLK